MVFSSLPAVRLGYLEVLIGELLQNIPLPMELHRLGLHKDATLAVQCVRCGLNTAVSWLSVSSALRRYWTRSVLVLIHAHGVECSVMLWGTSRGQ